MVMINCLFEINSHGDIIMSHSVRPKYFHRELLVGLYLDIKIESKLCSVVWTIIVRNYKNTRNTTSKTYKYIELMLRYTELN